MQGCFNSSFRTPCNAVKNPASFCRIIVRFIVSQSVFFFFCAAAATCSTGGFEGLSRHHRRRNHSMTSLPRKLSCLACIRLHCAPPFVFSVSLPPTSWPLYYQFLEAGMERKRASPGFAISVHNIQYPFLPPPAIKLTRHIFDWGRQHTVFRTIRDGRLRKRKSTHSFGASRSSVFVIWNRFLLSGSLKITYHLSRCMIASFIEVIGRG